MKITVATNAGEEARLVRQEIRAYQRDLRVKFRAASNMIRDAAKDLLKSGSPLRVSGRRDRPKIGPLWRSIRARIRVSQNRLDLVARIGPSKRGFYGRFHETGLNATAETRPRIRRGVISGQIRRQHRFVLPARPFLEPTATRTEGRAVAIVGDSFGVFQSGARIRSFGDGE